MAELCWDSAEGDRVCNASGLFRNVMDEILSVDLLFMFHPLARYDWCSSSRYFSPQGWFVGMVLIVGRGLG